MDAGLVTDDRAARIVSWFGAHWSEVVQDGQIRHLPLVGRGVVGGAPAGEYWPDTTTWQHQTFANGGYWAMASSFVLPVIATNDTVVAQSLVRDAIDLVRHEGVLSEWSNNKFCCNCKGAASW